MAYNRELSQFASFVEVGVNNTIGITTSVGIGTTNPTAKLDVNGSTVISNTGAGPLNLYKYGTSAPTILMYGANGTAASPSQTLDGDVIGGLNMFGYGPSDWAGGPSARINVIASENNGATSNRGADIKFETVTNGGVSLQEKMRLTNAGNLGIGTTNPGAPLTIKSDSTSHAIRILGRTVDNISALVFYNSAQDTFYSYLQSAQTYLAFGINGINEVSRFDASGNFLIGAATSTGTASQRLQVTGGAYVSGFVGIGTTNPESILHVYGNTTSVGQIIEARNSLSYSSIELKSGIGTTAISLALYASSNENVSILRNNSNTTGAGLGLCGTQSGGADLVIFRETRNVVIGNNPQSASQTGTANQKLQVQSGAYVSGSVGIGTTNPSTLLDVFGTSITVGNNSTTVTQIIRRNTDSGLALTGGGANIELYGSTHASVADRAYYDAVIHQFRNAGATSVYATISTDTSQFNNVILVGSGTSTGTASQRLQVTGGAYVSGFVGIGTTNPQASLDVLTSQQLVSNLLSSNASGGYIIVGKSGAGSIIGNYTSASGGGTAVNGNALFLRSANGIGFGPASGGIQAFFDTSGNLGIGTTNPTSRLQVQGDVRISGVVTATSFFGDGSGLIGVSASKWTTTSVGIHTLVNVGIGTTNPTSKLTVRGDVSIASTVGIGTVIDIIPYDTLNSGTLSFEGSAGQLFSITNNLTSGSIFSVNDVSGIPSIDVDANGTIELAPFNGRVGIGTTNPTTKLDVYGSGSPTNSTPLDNTIRIYTTSSTGSGSQLILNSTAITSGKSWALVSVGSTTSGSNIPAPGSFIINDNSTNTPRLVINPSGNVGIGTTNPIQKLDVSGEACIANRESYFSAPGDLFSFPGLENDINYVASSYEITEVQCVADVAGSLNSKYFTIYGPVGVNTAATGIITTFNTTLTEQLVTVWFNVAGAGVTPAVVGAGRSVGIAITTGASAVSVASSIATQMSTDAAFSIGNTGIGTIYFVANTPNNFSNPNAGTSGFAVTTTSNGSGSLPVGADKWIGGVLAPNGKIYGLPYSSTSVLVIDPVTGITTTFGSLSGTTKWYSGVLAPNGKIYCIPQDSTSVLVIDPATNTTSTFGSLSGTSKWLGGVLAPNGKIYGIPYNSTSVLVIDPVTNTASTFGSLAGTQKWVGGVLAPNGKIYGIPYSSTSVLVIDPVTNTTSTFGSLAGGAKWIGGVLAPNGKIYGIPITSTSVLVIDPVTNTTSTFGSLGAGNKWAGGVLAPNGKIYGIPLASNAVLSIGGGNAAIPNWYLSAYQNKF